MWSRRSVSLVTTVANMLTSVPHLQSLFADRVPDMAASWSPAPFCDANLFLLNDSLATELGLDPEWLRTENGLRFLLGEQLPEGAHPAAQAYSGHQFGQFSPILGDGRAVLLGELDTPLGRRDLHLKGSGRTPLTRGHGDGRCGLGPALREYLISEAMHALDIPTTRSLAVILTGETVMRNHPEPGAVVVRVARSHLRVGSVQFARIMQEKNPELLRQLADWAIESIEFPHPVAPGDYLGLLREVTHAQAHLVAQWMHVGFVHGVMNTDNTSLSGDTIDYGPCAFLNAFDPAACFSSIDHRHRYAFGRQPSIMLWNLQRLADALLPLIESQVAEQTSGETEQKAIDAATEVLQGYFPTYRRAWLDVMGRALGFNELNAQREKLCEDFAQWLSEETPDHLTVMHALAQGGFTQEDPPQEGREKNVPLPNVKWIRRWEEQEPDRALMLRTNPIRIPRNQLVEDALAAAMSGNLEPFERLFAAVTDPFESEAERARGGVGQKEGKKNDTAKEAGETERPRLHDPIFRLPDEGGNGDYRTYCGT